MPARPVAQAITYTTSTGQFGPAYFGTGHMTGGIQFTNTSTLAGKGTVQYSLSRSKVWVDLITLTSASTRAITKYATSTGVFDRLRVNLTDNELSATGTSGQTVWLGAY